MLINKENKIIVLQNPKTGGQFKANQIVGNNSGFIRKHIYNFYQKDGENYYVIFPFHITYQELKDYLGEDFKNWVIYTVVRNPYDRVASAINFRRKNLAQLYKDKDDSFDHCLDLILTHKEILLPKYETIWFTAQSFWIGPEVKILKYESIEDWQFLDNLLGIKNNYIQIKTPYNLSDSIKNKIKEIYYPLDKDIFKLYE